MYLCRSVRWCCVALYAHAQNLWYSFCTLKTQLRLSLYVQRLSQWMWWLSFYGPVVRSITILAKYMSSVGQDASNKPFITSVIALPQKRVLAPKIPFFFVGKNLLLHAMMMKKFADRGFLPFWQFKNERKFRRKRKNTAKNVKFSKKWVLTTTNTSSTKPWNIRTYHHKATMRITDSALLIPTAVSSFVWILSLSKSNSSAHLFRDQSVTNAKTIFVPNTTKLQFYCEYNYCERETAPSLQIIIITW